MKKNFDNKKKMIIGITVCTLLIVVSFYSAVAKDPKPKDKPDLDWDYWTNGSHMFSNVTGNVGIGTTNPSEKLEVDGNVKITGELTVNGSIIGDVEIETIHVSQITGLLGQGYTLMFPDIINNVAPLEIDCIGVADNDVVILHGPGYDIERILGYDSNGVPNDQPGFAMEHPLMFEVGGDYAIALKAWFDENPPDPEVTSGSIILENLAGNEVTRWCFTNFSPEGYEPGIDGRTRFTLKHNRLPDEYALWELNGPNPFGYDGSRNLETDLQVIIDGVDGLFYPIVVDDEINRTLNLTFDYAEGACIFDLVLKTVSGTNDKRSLEVNCEDEEGNLLWKRGYRGTFPIKYEIIYGYGLNTKIKARVIISYDGSNLS